MNGKRNLVPWWLIFIGFTFGAFPGIVLLVIRLLQEAAGETRARRAQELRERAIRAEERRERSSSGERRYTGQPRTYRPPQQQAQSAAYRAPAQSTSVRGRPGAAQGPGGLTARQRELISGHGGKGMWVGGVITLITALGICLAVMAVSLASGDPWGGLIACFILALSVGLPGAVLAITGNTKRNRAARCRNYVAMVGDSRHADLDELAAATGVSYQQVRRDLEWMLDEGFFPGCFLDGSTRTLSNPDARKQRAKPAPEPAPPAQDDGSGFPEERRIRELNDRIDDEYVSARMERLEALTHRILAYVAEHPEKEKDIRQFRNHYLPTTFKVLESYARFEQQNVDGENISAAMKDVESIMDKLVYGFEKQLDALYAAEAMDVTTDISVLENMLDMGGLGPLGPFSGAQQTNEHERTGQ